MGGVLLGASAVVPAWGRKGVPVEGPDEDAFTLLVRAGDLLRRSAMAAREGPGMLRALRLVAPLTADERSDLFEAWGIPPVEVVAYPLTEEGMVQALSDAMDAPGGPRPESDGVLVCEVASGAGTGGTDPPRRPAGAVGLQFGARSGAKAKEGTAAPPTGAVTVRTGPSDEGGAAPPSGRAGSASAQLSALRVDPKSPLGIGLTLAEAAFLAEPGSPALWVHPSPLRTAVRQLLDGRKVPVLGFPLPSPDELWPVSDESWRARAGAPLGNVSQGAYLSREGYRSSLPARWRLEGEVCAACRGWTLPPSGTCRHCGLSKGLRRDRLARTGGTLESLTVIRPGAQPTEFDYQQETSGPYAVGLLRFPQGPTLTFQLTDGPVPPDGWRGREVELELRRLYPQEGAWRYGLKAVLRPAVRRTDDAPAAPTRPATKRKAAGA